MFANTMSKFGFTGNNDASPFLKTISLASLIAAFSIEFSKNHPNCLFIGAQHGGKAVALMHGVNEASGKIILFTDMDQSTPISEVNKLLSTLDKGYDIAIGSRGNRRNNATISRKLASFIFSSARRILLLAEISDTQCGFKVFKNSAKFKRIFSALDATKVTHIEGWKVTAFDVELLFLCKKAGIKIKEVLVEWNNEDISDTKSRKFLKESADMFHQIFKIRQNDITGKYSWIKSETP